MEQPFDRSRSAIAATEHGRMIAIGEVRFHMFLFGSGTVETEHGTSTVGTLDPFVRGSELKAGKLGLSGDESDCAQQGRGVHAVEGRTGWSGLDIHRGLLRASAGAPAPAIRTFFLKPLRLNQRGNHS